MSTHHETVARRAYEIWREHGCPEGQDERIWRAAEHETRRLGLWAWVRVRVFEVTPETDHDAVSAPGFR